ncbi:unnamed protein product, partial [Oppiella nova]
HSLTACDGLTFMSRNQWKARSRKANDPPQRLPTPVSHVFIHHTVTPDQCHNQAAYVAAVRSMQDFHMDNRNWSDIGYNFLMGGDGRIYEARGWYTVRAHTLGMNDKSVNLALMGNYESVAPPKKMLDLAQKWVECAVEKGVVSGLYQLHGHRDQTCTSSPGQAFYDIIKSWKYFKGGPLDTYIHNTNLQMPGNYARDKLSGGRQ